MFYSTALFFAKTKQAIDKTIVTGVNTIFSKLFIENKLPIAFNTNKANIIHSITFINLLDSPSFICLCFLIAINKKSAFKNIENASKASISLSFVNRPPQAISYEITLKRINK
ncbi:MAG: hypothetical protein IPG89_17065 [Bacteroidetes bacterium]|nr:hypothetical protein [Bacteroidota bacterium]